MGGAEGKKKGRGWMTGRGAWFQGDDTDTGKWIFRELSKKKIHFFVYFSFHF